MRPLLSTLYVLFKNGCLLSSIILLSACSGISYYSQSISGQLEIVSKKQNINDVIKDVRTPESLRQKLSLVENIRNFAEQQLLLPANGSYEKYVDLGRPYVVWNIFATPELSLEPLHWCFIIVGCLSYRGYFNKTDAEKFASVLEKQGMDVYVGGVRAFSTLGWFNDPVLNTMLYREDHELAKLLFHELSHQKLYIKDDTAFNEAFADTIAIIGTERWLTKQNRDQHLPHLESKRERQFSKLILEYRTELESIYSSDLNDEQKRSQKSLTIENLRQAYKSLRDSWGGYAAFDAWMDSPINNAKLSAVATYQYFVSDFMTIYRKVGGELSLFYSIVEKLGTCDKSYRHELLEKHATLISC